MFGVLIIDNGEIGCNTFKIFKTLDEAQNYAHNAKSWYGLKTTIYDYDTDSDSYCEFFDVG